MKNLLFIFTNIVLIILLILNLLQFSFSLRPHTITLYNSQGAEIQHWDNAYYRSFGGSFEVKSGDERLTVRGCIIVVKD